MTIQEVNRILKDKSMQQFETNFKVIKPKTGGKTPKLTLKGFYAEYQADKLEFQKFLKQYQEDRLLLIELYKQVLATNARIDNLVAKNNLKE